MSPALKKNLLDLAMTFCVPLLILSPNLFGTGWGVAALLGGDQGGHIRAYLLSALLPVVYTLWTFWLRRETSPIARFGVVTSLLGAGLAFWFVDGFWYAFKTSVHLYLHGLLFLGSALVGSGLLRSLLQGAFAGGSVAHRRAQEEALNHPRMARALVLGSVLFGGAKLLFGSVNMAVQLHLVTASFGTAAFNGQVVLASAVMYLPGLLIGGLVAAPAMLLAERTVKAIYGQDVSLLRPEGLARQLAPAA
ncbi:VC0807 family protein [Deinococcus aquaedulcis]|uniref:VC0807 family protein n=1 Tax=Deinococcus aquaedulcis TaxID=2840455 RepID=UPI001C82B9B8|nr:VC0807 family protein [Deinococcus aquaedulcis]